MPVRIHLLDRVIEIAPELEAGDLLSLLYRHLLTSADPDARLELERAGQVERAVRLVGLEEPGKEGVARRVVAPGESPLVAAHRLLLEHTLGETRRFLVLHASAVAVDGRALLVLGESWAGKTTLVETLLQRGFQLLSDDYAPLRASDLKVTPFPRALGRRQPGSRPHAPPLLARAWVDPEAVAPLGVEPVAVGAIAVLEEAGPGAPAAPLRPLPATEVLAHLLTSLRNPGAIEDAAARLAALAASVPAASLARGPLEEMARSVTSLLP